MRPGGILTRMDPDRYELLDVIGSGGMATVWRASDARLNRLVAIKRPHPAPAGSDSLVRFAREARVAATVSHPNLVAVYDAGTDELGPYLVMELVDGPSLATAPSPPSDPARIGSEVASALAALHGAGIVHGDVKPGNILLAGDGAKLTDFGIARAADDATLTRTGMTYGTPAYAAPETLAHGDRTAAADVYSLGAVLYELSTGERWSSDAAGTRAMPTGAAIAPLTAALSNDPSARPSAATLAAQLRSPGVAAPPVAAPTTAMAAGGAPPIVPAVDRPYESPAGPPRATQRTALVVFVLGALVVAGVVAFALRDDDPSTASTATSGVATTAAAGSATTAAPPTTAATTVLATTAPATTAPPTTAAPTTPTTVPVDPAVAIADEITRLVDAATPDQVKPKEAKDIVQRIDDALRAADQDQTDEVEKKLREAAEQIDEHVAGNETRAALQSLLVDLADELGVDDDVVTEPFQGDDDDDD